MKNPEIPFNPEEGPKITIKRNSEAPDEVKKNPFYDPEFWGQAKSPGGIYLPDSDEGLSFPWAAHEIGHLVEEGKRDDASLDNFEATRAEEERAWNEGWKYLKKYLGEYYQNDPEMVTEIEQKYQTIKDLAMQVVDLSKEMYLSEGELDDASESEYQESLNKKRQETAKGEMGQKIMELFARIKEEKINIKPDWEKFVAVVTKAVEDILTDNKK